MRCLLPSRLPVGRLLAFGLLAVLTSGCAGTWFGEAEDPPLPGERISVLALEERLEPDPRLAELPVTLPPATANDVWPQAGGYPNHVMGHLALPASLTRAWSRDIGQGAGGDRRLMAAPIVVQGRVYALDADHTLSALDADTGSLLWQSDVSPTDEGGVAVGGGVAFAEGRLFVTTGFGEVLALAPDDGSVLWRRRVAGPVRAAPTVTGGRVFVVTIDNQFFALSAEDGAVLWSHTGILETASLLGSASPAAEGGIVAVPYSSGELFALRVENGRVAWSDNLAAVQRVGAATSLADIRGMPVIDRDLVLAISHSGRMVAVDEPSGRRVWEQDLGGIHMPWMAGDFVFVLTNEAQVVALTRRDGRVRWVTELERYQSPESRQGLILWAGPVLAGERLWLTNSRGELVALSPQTGEVLERLPLPSGATLPPVVANRTLYVLTDGGELVAFR